LGGIQVFLYRRKLLYLLAGAATLVGTVASPRIAMAEGWPSRPVTMVAPYAAGGPVDTVGRIMANGLSAALGQQVVIENVGGADVELQAHAPKQGQNHVE
jgi:tripartite-type tricarboxylate transporter receptor subunit TctC